MTALPKVRIIKAVKFERRRFLICDRLTVNDFVVCIPTFVRFFFFFFRRTFNVSFSLVLFFTLLRGFCV